MTLQYAKAERVSLKNHPLFNEAWLQGLIAEDPSILDLGDVVVLQRERRQDRAGRLDLLLSDPDSGRRYEVEIMLGPTDESHIIRCIEYWDIERRRFPQYDHIAVLIAEHVTSRFLNVLGLFNGSIPMIVIQLSALRIEDKLALNFVRVMDLFTLRVDEESEPPPPPADRAYWEEKAAPATVAIAERCVAWLNQAIEENRFTPTYNRHYVGLRDGNTAKRFIHFNPKKKFTHLLAQVSAPEVWTARLEVEGLEASLRRDGYLIVTIAPGELATHEGSLTELLREAFLRYSG